ncbi:MAG: methyltransferase domain-containing protein [Bacteroides sp.]|nr:methyltransferase domain-containing protein [Prevotella sp.]MCM1407993.1 methyltransferase domain-containing protein [Treponema brennaborense]MCM1468969.1 methyltransferase domain-containing protein [Bacteroides sp.]
MEYINNIIEYFDELYPVLPEQRRFYNTLASAYPMPVKFLRIGCRTGALEHQLAQDGHDVTGIEMSKELLDVASRRRRLPNMAVRFFQMATLDMTRFLGKKFYNVISCLDDALIFIHDSTLLRKFFYDCAQLLSENGKIILQLQNYSLYDFGSSDTVHLPDKESVRIKLFSHIRCADGNYLLNQELETSRKKRLPVICDEIVLPFSVQEIEAAARGAGFSSFSCFENYAKKPFAPESRTVVCVIG